uniref:Uncharacterized protein n=1 Tax=Glossina brevipalpis TaxID=37001 RepID=A0A1A9WIR2_9MUSC
MCNYVIKDRQVHIGIPTTLLLLGFKTWIAIVMSVTSHGEKKYYKLIWGINNIVGFQLKRNSAVYRLSEASSDKHCEYPYNRGQCGNISPMPAPHPNPNLDTFDYELNAIIQNNFPQFQGVPKLKCRLQSMQNGPFYYPNVRKHLHHYQRGHLKYSPDCPNGNESGPKPIESPVNAYMVKKPPTRRMFVSNTDNSLITVSKLNSRLIQFRPSLYSVSKPIIYKVSRLSIIVAPNLLVPNTLSHLHHYQHGHLKVILYYQRSYYLNAEEQLLVVVDHCRRIVEPPIFADLLKSDGIYPMADDQLNTPLGRIFQIALTSYDSNASHCKSVTVKIKGGCYRQKFRRQNDESVEADDVDYSR